MRWSVITKCDSFFITKCYKCYYKVRHVLQSVTILLQSATGITKCDSTHVLFLFLCISLPFSANLRVKKHFTRKPTLTANHLIYQKKERNECISSCIRVGTKQFFLLLLSFHRHQIIKSSVKWLKQIRPV